MCSSIDDGDPNLDIGEFTGFCLILGPWVVHLFEAGTDLMKHFINKLHAKITTKVNERGAYY